MGACVISRRTSSVTTMGTSWAAFASDGSWDLTIAATAGDVIELGVSVLWNTGAVFTRMDAATMVSGTATNWVSSGSGSHSGGVFAWFQEDSNDYGSSAGSVLYTVQSGDVVSGQVTFRLYGQTVSGTRAIVAASTEPAHFWAAVCDNTPSTSSLSGTLSSTSYVALTGSATVTASAGDVLACSLNAVAEPGGLSNFDAATMVSGSPVNWFSTGGSSHNGGAGAWRAVLTDYEPVSGSVLYTVQSGDVVSGQVTVRVYATVSSGSRVIASGSTFTVRKV